MSSKRSKRRKKAAVKHAIEKLTRVHHAIINPKDAEIKEYKELIRIRSVVNGARHPLVTWAYHSWKLISWVLGFILLVFGYIALFPKVSVTVVGLPDPKQAITTKFEVKNEGQLSINDVYASAKWLPFNRTKGPGQQYMFYNEIFEFADTNKETELDSGRSFTCHFDEFSKTPVIPAALDYEVEIIIVYRPAFWWRNITNRFELTAGLSADGDYIFTKNSEDRDIGSFLEHPDLH